MTTNHETVGDVPPDFGDYVLIEQKRYGVPNEMYVHKVVGRLRSNTWVDVPVQAPATATMHDTIEDVVACICCGVDETQVRRYRLSDVKLQRAHARDTAMRKAVRQMAHALESGEWAEHALDSDDDVSRLEAQITRLVGAHAAGPGRVPALPEDEMKALRLAVAEEALRSCAVAFADTDPEARFIEECAHLNCPACGGSGHIDDALMGAEAPPRLPAPAVDEAMPGDLRWKLDTLRPGNSGVVTLSKDEWQYVRAALTAALHGDKA